MTPGKQSSEYGLAKIGVAGAALSATVASLVEAGVLGPETELTWPMAVVLAASLISGAIITGMYSFSRGQAKMEFRSPNEDK